MTVCKRCGLPLEICACGAMAKESAKIRVYVVRRRFGKAVTVVEGIGKDANPKELMKKLKSKLAAGGTYKDDKIEIQGDHLARVKKVLLESGFDEEQFEN